MNTLDKKYTDLLQDILENGVKKKDRTGTGTLSVFGREIRHKMSEGFPLLTTKKMYFKGIVTELLWFLRGDTSIVYLLENDCHIWDGDAFKRYLTDLNRENVSKDDQDYILLSKEEFINKIKTDDEFAEKWGELGPIYGKQWRKWGGELVTKRIKEEGKFHVSQNVMGGQIDQIANAIHKLKTNPDDRGIIVSAWNVGELDDMVLRPCHYGFQVYTRELSRDERIQIYVNEYMGGVGKPAGFEDAKLATRNIPTRAISLMFNMRSTDVGLGLSFNLASYGLLLMMIAKQVNMIPDELIYNGGDVHLYLNHIEPIKEQLTREPYELPTVKISDRVVNDISEYTLDDIILENYQSHPAIKMPLSN